MGLRELGLLVTRSDFWVFVWVLKRREMGLVSFMRKELDLKYENRLTICRRRRLEERLNRKAGEYSRESNDKTGSVSDLPFLQV